MAARTTKTTSRYEWVIDFGDGTEAKSYKTMGTAIARGERALQVRKAWAERYAHDTVQDIEDAIVQLNGWREFEHYAYFEPREMSTYVDRYTSSRMIVRLSRITKEQ
jgi:hypothetical protein